MSYPSPPPTGSASRPAPSLTVLVDLVCGTVRLAGLIDRDTVHLFRDAVTALLLAEHDTWVVDATDLTGCDPMGVRAIGSAYRRALRHDRRMTVTGAPPLLRRSLARLRLDFHVLDGGGGTSTVPTALPA